MKLFVMRHGSAEPWLSDEGDASRALTLYGREEVSRQGAEHAQRCREIECWVSPYLRAQQTAELFTKDLNASINTTQLITPESTLVGILDALLPQTRDLLLVTHQPLVSKMISVLTGRAPFDCPMNTASFAILEGDVMAPDCMSLKGIWHSDGTVSR